MSVPVLLSPRGSLVNELHAVEKLTRGDKEFVLDKISAAITGLSWWESRVFSTCHLCIAQLVSCLSALIRPHVLPEMWPPLLVLLLGIKVDGSPLNP